MATKSHKPISEMTTEEIAAEINATLKRWEASKAINSPRGSNGLFSYYGAGAHGDRGTVSVCYISYQGSTRLKRVQAAWYLELLRQGHVGRHFELFRQHGEASGTLENPENLFRVAEPGRRPQFVDGSSKAHAKLTAVYYRVVELVTPAVDTSKMPRDDLRKIQNLVPKLKEFYARGSFDTIRSGSPELQEALTDLFTETLRSLSAAKKRGHGEGTNLIAQLARGTITVGELNSGGKKRE